VSCDRNVVDIHIGAAAQNREAGEGVVELDGL
jgi:hypothetical protein